MKEEVVLNDVDVLPAPVIEPWTPPAVPTPIPRFPDWEREREAFKRMLPELLKTHRDQYVAVYQEKVVDSGDDLIAVVLRVYARYGYVPTYADLVTDQPPRVERIASPREFRWVKPR